MSTRVLIPSDVQNLIDEIRPYLAPEMKEIDVIRSVLVNFKLNQNKQLEAQKLQNLRKELQIGIDQMNEGKFSDLTLEDVLKQIHQKD
jgi:ABC-type transporter Mla subunit MlaD